MIDTHAHVHDRAFDADRDAVIARARAASVTAMITIGEDLADGERALACANAYDLRAAVGVHPHEAKDAPADLAGALTALLRDPRVAAVGEIGLDYHYDRSPREVQRDVLRTQVRVARERGLPAIFHVREAHDDLVAILREEFAPGMRGVVHCFSGDEAQARTYVEQFGLRLGIGGVLTFKNAEPLRAAVRAVGLAPLVLETDCPYLAPVPHRGARNEPAFVASTAAKLAEVLALPLDAVIAATTATAIALFDL